ncbi:MAG: protein translocase subunit SecF [Ignavibacteriae bacterium]|nr:protein translocase subunit SecF [Ignavibacteriota bacterium]MCB9215317.1 protein translocase subunit SecF [Ignavibacteria bacterium]
MQFFSNTHIDFLGKRKIFYMVSLVVTIAGISAALLRGVEFGIDFEGGAEGDIRFTTAADIGTVRSAIESAGFKGAEVKSGGENDVLIRVKNPESVAEDNPAEGAPASEVLTTELTQALKTAYPDQDGKQAFEIREVRIVGPKVGKELRTQALWAVLASILAILLYITFRFEWVYGLGAIIALVHDVLVAFSFAVLCNGLFGLNLEMNQGMLAAFLTVVGFSINDTVIIFDRIRENKGIHRGENLMMLMNRSINETLPRTINTSLTVILVLAVLLIFSGDALQGFAFTMLVGIITGTYSSIYIASSFVIDTMIRRGKLDPNAEGDFKQHVIEARQARRAGQVTAKAEA